MLFCIFTCMMQWVNCKVLHCTGTTFLGHCLCLTLLYYVASYPVYAWIVMYIAPLSWRFCAQFVSPLLSWSSMEIDHHWADIVWVHYSFSGTAMTLTWQSISVSGSAVVLGFLSTVFLDTLHTVSPWRWCPLTYRQQVICLHEQFVLDVI